ncbi:hypothetical protein ABID99_003980 [Mucilaginibacter sp. OAE612]|uniref:hypothetical protein n=1 Tax=Mucilaginibacter sp. OAE612 TaxID=3156444 RepID=UPI00359E1821
MNIRRIVVLLMLLNVSLTGSLFAAEIWVSPKGSDTNTGTREQPLATVAMAIRKARELRRLNDPSIKGGIYIKVAAGVYMLDEPLFIRPEDSGTADSPTIIEGEGIGKTVLSGGIKVSGWHKVDYAIPGLPAEAKGKVWVADAPMIGDEPFQFRQLWVNNEKAIRARDTEAPFMNRILSWNHKTPNLCNPVASLCGYVSP